MKSPPKWQVGVARRVITPPNTVELAGLGYYLNRTGKRVRDDLTATALVISSRSIRSGSQMGAGEDAVVIVAMDLMWNNAAFTKLIRDGVRARTGIPERAVCVNFSHSHNAPTAGLILGAGVQDWNYLRFAAEQAVEAVAEAWSNQAPAQLRIGQSKLELMTFNRTREHGPVDRRVGVLRADTLDGAPLAMAVNFHSHCTAHMEVDLNAISRDWPGEVVGQIESAMPGVTALYLQGVCGDVNFRREYNGTELRFEPARQLAGAALEAAERSDLIEGDEIRSTLREVTLPTRRWTREEIMKDREEGVYRLKSGDTTGWLEGVAKVCVNLPERLPLRYGGSVENAVAAVSRFAMEWTDLILPNLETMPECLKTEVQAMRIGDFDLVATPCELFTSLGMAVRDAAPDPDCFILGYSNGSIGYLPDAYDVKRRSYAAIQSPKMTGQFPFTDAAGLTMVKGMVEALLVAGSNRE